MRNVASPLNYFTRLSLFCNLQHTAGVEQLLGQRVTTGRENMTSDGRKTSVYRRWVDRECGAAGAAGGGRAASLEATRGSLRKGLGPLDPEGSGP